MSPEDHNFDSPIDEARSTLLRALDELEKAESELENPVQRVDLMVIYSLGCRDDNGWHEIEGYSSTPGPMWLHATMLRRAADAHEESVQMLDEFFDDGVEDEEDNDV